MLHQHAAARENNYILYRVKNGTETASKLAVAIPHIFVLFVFALFYFLH